MTVQVECVRLATTRQEGRPDQLVMKPIGTSPNGHHEVVVSGPRAKVKAWLKRNGYHAGEFTLVEA